MSNYRDWVAAPDDPAILRPGIDSPSLRYVAGPEPSYRPWVACVGGFLLADVVLLVLGIGGSWWAWVFALIGTVPLAFLPSRIAVRRRALGVERSAARRDGGRAADRHGHRLFSAAELTMGAVAAGLIVLFVVLQVRLLTTETAAAPAVGVASFVVTDVASQVGPDVTTGSLMDVSFRVTNKGIGPGVPACLVQAVDRSGTVLGTTQSDLSSLGRGTQVFVADAKVSMPGTKNPVGVVPRVRCTVVTDR